MTGGQLSVDEGVARGTNGALRVATLNEGRIAISRHG